jgi:iron complex outermembrane receptor protein
MSLEELGNLQVTSVSKAPDPLSQAAAAIYVITHEDIQRSGVTSIPEALRLAPNLQVTQLSASQYTVTARGFGDNTPDQSFANKMLLLIDGRSTYNPLFSGIYLDGQDVMMADVDRIEVISGPGATLWGANAVNGVINIVTRSANLSDGVYTAVRGGNLERDLEARVGSRLSDDSAFRVDAKAFKRNPMENANGASAHDDWYKTQAGLRYDWSGDADSITAQADMYRALENQKGATGDLRVTGADVLSRWTHRTEYSTIELQAYYDMSERASPPGGAAFVLHTWDVQLQQTLRIGSDNRLIWGAGERLNSYGITNSGGLRYDPDSRDLTLGNLFLQDTQSVGQYAKLTAGVKFEDDPFAGWQIQPDVRASVEVPPNQMLWAAASRAIRSPTPFDVDVREYVGTQLALFGNASFRPERVTAYELGYRAQPASALSFSLSGFYNIYDDLRTIELSPVTGLFPITWGNNLHGHTAGIEGWATWDVTDSWRISPGFRTLHKSLSFKPGGTTSLGTAQAGDDPRGQITLGSSLNLGTLAVLDTTFRYVSSLPKPALQAYAELNASFRWRVTHSVELSLTGLNLLHARHLEYPAPYGEYIVRSVLAGIEWRPGG